MRLYFDNFLPQELFYELNKRMLWRFGSTRRWDHATEIHETQAVRFRTKTDNHDYTEAACILGAMVPNCVNHIRNHLITNLQFQEPEAHYIWFQYMNMKQTVGKHLDGISRNRKAYQCFRGFLYTHSEWEDNWGGELCIGPNENDEEAINILPKPNRLIVYSVDQTHWVKPVRHGRSDYQRMFLGTSWTTFNTEAL